MVSSLAGHIAIHAPALPPHLHCNCPGKKACTNAGGVRLQFCSANYCLPVHACITVRCWSDPAPLFFCPAGSVAFDPISIAGCVKPCTVHSGQYIRCAWDHNTHLKELSDNGPLEHTNVYCNTVKGCPLDSITVHILHIAARARLM